MNDDSRFTIDDALVYLLALGHETLAMKLGLSNTERLLAALGEPQKSYLKIQIAGTNGKGSTAAFLDAICRAAGVKTGLFTSPHLVSVTERIKLNGADISETKFAELTFRVKETVDRMLASNAMPARPTFFEHLTAIGLLAFAEAPVDLAILETGLGGRLDATTAAASELVCLTPIDLDHQEYLGDSIEEIAAEKAAIIRAGVEVCVVSQQKPAALDVILRRCDELNVMPLVDACRFLVKGATDDGRLIATFQTANAIYENVCLALRGRHQMENAATAIVAAENLTHVSIPPGAIVAGLSSARHAGRLELTDGVLFDGAHNAAGALALEKFLREFVKTKITLVFGAMRDKDSREIAHALFPLADNLILTRADNPRSAAPADLLRFVPKDFPPEKIFLAETASEAIKKARQTTAPSDLICVTGSLYLVGEYQANLNHRDTETQRNKQ